MVWKLVVLYLALSVFCGLRITSFEEKKNYRISKAIVMDVDTKRKSIRSFITLSHKEKVRFRYQNQHREVEWIWKKPLYYIIESKEGILLVHRWTNKIEEYPAVDALPDKYIKFKEWRSKMVMLQEYAKSH